ncbi:MAG: hypothetical protein WCF24_09235, partial [Acidimicrobiales bacterium]
TGLTDDYEHAGRVIYEILDRAVHPSGLNGSQDYDAFLSLGATYKQLEASVGEFGMATLEAATIGLESTTTSTYQTMATDLKSLGSQRDALAATIESDLESVEFHGGSLSAAQADALTTQARALISQAESLPGKL